MCLQDWSPSLKRLEMAKACQRGRPDSRCVSPCKLICNAEVPEGRGEKKKGLPLMLLIRSALWLFFLKLFISFCLNPSFLFFFFFCAALIIDFSIFPSHPSPDLAIAPVLLQECPARQYPEAHSPRRWLGSPVSLSSPTAPTSQPLAPTEAKNQRERPLKYTHVYNEGALKNNKHIHQRKVGVQKRERENWRNVGLQVFLKSEQHRVGEKENTIILCFKRGGKGPQPVVMVAGATHLCNHISEPRTTRGSAACLWTWREHD